MNCSKKTKIIATVGPASNTKEKLLELVHAGVNIFRLNFSHGTHEQHKQVISHIRALNKEHNLHITILQDLQGPKIRTDEIENNGVELCEGAIITIASEKILGTKERVSTSYINLSKDVKVGDMILIDDGNIELRVLDTSNKEVKAEIIYGGVLKSRKGINLPNTNVSEPSLTKKDREDLVFGLENNLDWIALSFVRKAEDIIELKEILKQHNSRAKIIAKIEKPEAIQNIDAIIEESDAIMVARGDLGVEIQMEEVPVLQKMIVEKCNKVGKPVIIATQMMESMIKNPRPTRAEANDVANAILDGADVVMLSAETASGDYPVLTVNSMSRICLAIERQRRVYNKFLDFTPATPDEYSESLIATACSLAARVNAKAIIGLSQTGFSAYQIASHRPKANVFIVTSDRVLMTQLNLIWGVKAFYFDEWASTDATIESVKEMLIKEGYLNPGDVYVATANMPIAKKQRANMLKLGLV